MALMGDHMSLYADTETTSMRMVGVTLDASRHAELILKPPFMGDVFGSDSWVVPGSAGTVHVVWTTPSVSPVHVVHTSTDGARWASPDTLFSVSPDFTESDVVAAAGDDVVVALPATIGQFSGLVVGTRRHGKWAVDRFDVPHEPLHDLPLATGMDRSGTTVAYFRLSAPSGGRTPSDSLGLYARHRPWGGAWGPETQVYAHEGFSSIAVETRDGVFHLFWHGMSGADSSILHHAETRDFKSWQLAQVSLPPDIQSIEGAPEGNGARIVMLQADSPNGLEMKYSRLVTVGWGPSGFSAFDSIPGAHPGDFPSISRVANDTSVVIWDGMRVAVQSTRHPRKGPSHWTSYVPVTILARHVRDCPR